MTGEHKRHMSLERKRSFAGFLFVLPWVVGFLGLFLRPLVTSFLYSINTTQISGGGMLLKYSGFGSYYKAFFTDLNFVRYLTGQIGDMVYSVPVIIAFSLLIAVIISGNFKGRTLVRTIFFLPVICGSGIILSIMSGDALSNSIISGTRSSMLFQTTGIDTILLNAGVSTDLVKQLMSIVQGIFSLSWKSGLQILLFMSGLLTVPPSLYESAKIEGATKWEMFWKITFPMLSPIMVLNVVYTIIDRFTDYSNNVMQYIHSFAKNLDFNFSSALSWIYFVVVLVFVGIVYAVINKRVVYTVD